MIDYLVSLLVVASALAVILLLMGRHKAPTSRAGRAIVEKEIEARKQSRITDLLSGATRPRPHTMDPGTIMHTGAYGADEPATAAGDHAGGQNVTQGKDTSPSADRAICRPSNVC